MVDTDGEKKEMCIKDKVVFPTGVDDSKNPENMEALFTYIRSWGAEE